MRALSRIFAIFAVINNKTLISPNIIESWIIWLIAACILLLIEVLSQAVWALCLSVGCTAAIGVSFFTDSPAIQAVSVPIAALLCWILLAPAVRKWESRRGKTTCTGMDALIGRHATVIDEIRPGELGRVRIDGDNWQVNSPGIACTVRRGDEVIVTGYNSIILTVKPTTINQ